MNKTDAKKIIEDSLLELVELPLDYDINTKLDSIFYDDRMYILLFATIEEKLIIRNCVFELVKMEKLIDNVHNITIMDIINAFHTVSKED